MLGPALAAGSQVMTSHTQSLRPPAPRAEGLAGENTDTMMAVWSA